MGLVNGFVTYDVSLLMDRISAPPKNRLYCKVDHSPTIHADRFFRRFIRFKLP